jgi:hypothetical protein
VSIAGKNYYKECRGAVVYVSMAGGRKHHKECRRAVYVSMVGGKYMQGCGGTVYVSMAGGRSSARNEAKAAVCEHGDYKLLGLQATVYVMSLAG